ncbi:hypothetical protein SDC9_101054 [bioreactor metagenome]|uniref:Uncharacterized protein n=1 Tax=bioreactor metagenome TaxID=1076179 RepID=A0A645AMX4_9ZZZZ
MGQVGLDGQRIQIQLIHQHGAGAGSEAMPALLRAEAQPIEDAAHGVVGHGAVVVALAGEHIAAVASQLGHEDVEMVFRTYGKFIRDDYQKPKPEFRIVKEK